MGEVTHLDMNYKRGGASVTRMSTCLARYIAASIAIFTSLAISISIFTGVFTTSLISCYQPLSYKREWQLF